MLLCDGFTTHEAGLEQTAPGQGFKSKWVRERDFPMALLEAGCTVDITTSEASVAQDRRSILNSINLVAPELIHVVEPDLSHPECHKVNLALRSLFAEVTIESAARAGRLESALSIVGADDKRRSLRLAIKDQVVSSN